MAETIKLEERYKVSGNVVTYHGPVNQGKIKNEKGVVTGWTKSLVVTAVLDFTDVTVDQLRELAARKFVANEVKPRLLNGETNFRVADILAEERVRGGGFKGIENVEAFLAECAKEVPSIDRLKRAVANGKVAVDDNVRKAFQGAVKKASVL